MAEPAPRRAAVGAGADSDEEDGSAVGSGFGAGDTRGDAASGDPWIGDGFPDEDDEEEAALRCVM